MPPLYSCRAVVKALERGRRGSEGGCATIRAPESGDRRTMSLDLITGVPKGTVYRQLASGGGGFGDPRERPATYVAAEVRNGVISREAAQKHYGVVVRDDFTIDEKATRDLRGF